MNSMDRKGPCEALNYLKYGFKRSGESKQVQKWGVRAWKVKSWVLEFSLAPVL